MPLSKLDDICALIVIDLQKGIAGLPTAHPFGGIVDRAAQLARAFRKRGLPVVLVNVSGMAPGRSDTGGPKFSPTSDWAELLPELGRQPSDHVVTKQRRGAFIGTDLHERLSRLGATQVVMAGVATSSGVESTARSAHDLGYNVAFVVDAMTDVDAEMHRHSVEKVFPRMGETCSTEDVLNMLKAVSDCA